MKKTETIDAWNDDRMREFAAESPFLKITGEIAEVMAIDLAAGKVFSTKRLATKEGPWGVAFARWLLDVRGHRAAFPDQPRGGEYGVAFYGFNLKRFFRVLGVECNTANCEVPLGLWYGNEMCFDPYEMLVENDHGGMYRQMFSLRKVLARGGLTMKDGYVPGVDTTNDTRVVMEMLSRFRLVPTLDLANAREMLKAKAFSTQVLETGTDSPDAEPDVADNTASATEVPAKAPTGARTGKKKSAKKKSS